MKLPVRRRRRTKNLIYCFKILKKQHGRKKNVLLTGRTPEQDQARAGVDRGGGKEEMGQEKKAAGRGGGVCSLGV